MNRVKFCLSLLSLLNNSKAVLLFSLDFKFFKRDLPPSSARQKARCKPRREIRKST